MESTNIASLDQYIKFEQQEQLMDSLEGTCINITFRKGDLHHVQAMWFYMSHVYNVLCVLRVYLYICKENMCHQLHVHVHVCILEK